MKAIVAYYSLEGNTKIIAETIAEEVGCDIIQLTPKKEIPKIGFLKYLLGGMQVVFNKKPELHPINKNFDEYDLIVFGSPVWASSYTPVFNTLFSQISIKNKKIAVFCCYKGDEGKTFEQFKNKLKDNEIIGQIGFKEPLANELKESVDRAKEWIADIMKK